MQEPGVIAAFAELLAAKLSFNPALSRRVRREVEDHLWEAVAASPIRNEREAALRAVSNFGDPHALATQFAIGWLAREIRKTTVALLLIVAGAFLVMKGRIAWYAATRWALDEEVRHIATTVVTIDAYAFWLAVLAGIAASACISRPFIPAAAHPAYCRRVRYFLMLGIATTSALACSVICDAILTALRLVGRDVSLASAVPLFSMAIEVAGVGFLIYCIGLFGRRVTHTLAMRRA
jgi:hypothetical protein